MAELYALTDAKRQMVRDAQIMLSHLESQLTTLNREIAAARDQVLEREREHTRLLTALDEHRASVEDAQGSLHSIQQNLETHEHQTENMLAHIDKSLDELDMLQDVNETYQVKINRLTQQVQWQDSELRLLSQTIHAKSTDIKQAQELLEQYDVELRRVIRQRQQREIDLAHARQGLSRQDDELRQLLRSQSPDEAPSPAPARRLSPGNRLDVTPRQSSLLPLPIQVPDNSDDGPDDDLTEIPGLAELYASQLRSIGIRTFAQLARANPEEIQRLLDIPGHYSPDIAAWIEFARRRTRNGSIE